VLVSTEHPRETGTRLLQSYIDVTGLHTADQQAIAVRLSAICRHDGSLHESLKVTARNCSEWLLALQIQRPIGLAAESLVE